MRNGQCPISHDSGTEETVGFPHSPGVLQSRKWVLYSLIGIIHELESRSIYSPTGKPKWCRRAIDTLLSNEKYRGGSTATTVLMSDAPQSKQRARYLFSDHHEAIIDEKTFIAVAKEKQRRCNIEVDENGVHRKKTRYTAKIRVSGSLKEE